MKNIAIIGSTGAIGSAFAELLLSTSEENHLYLFNRKPVSSLTTRVFTHSIDITDALSIQTAATAVSHIPFDSIIIATGMLHDTDLMPEKSYSEIQKENMEKSFLVNTIGPALLLKHFLPLTRKHQPVCCAVLSAKVGSITDNHLGGWYSYRMAKAALNMLIKTASIEFKRKNAEGVVIGLHPGTVSSQLSQPFLDNVQHTIFSPLQAAELMLNVIRLATPQDSGYCLTYDGQRLPF